jgi:diguanylate cyclase (GGDEF)-like protein/PAS domain S-box-containing protein
MATQSQAQTMGQRREPTPGSGQDLLSVLLEISDRAVIATTAEGTIARWNPAAEKTLGYLSVEAIGRPRSMVAAPDRAADMQSIFARALGGQKVSEHRTQLRHKGGHFVEVVLTAYPVAGAHGEIVGVAEVVSQADQKQPDAQPVAALAPDAVSRMSRFDLLTNLPNRSFFTTLGEEAIAEAKRTQRDLYALLIDLEGLAQINDTIGHAIGDALLRSLADRLRVYEAKGAKFGRIGGDEFAALYATSQGAVEAESLAKDIHRALTKAYEIGGYRLTLNASIGVSGLGEDRRDIEQLLKNAKTAASRASKAGDSVSVFDASMDGDLKARKTLETSLRNALARREFEVFYQPFADTKTERVRGYEALVRWRDPKLGMISPAEFVPLAEETGMIVPLGEFILRKACEDAADWPPYISIGVNISAAQCQEALVQTVVSALATSRLPPERLELEITESALLRDNSTTTSVLHKLRALGVRIAMDDFGTGYSSLSYLRSFPFDKIKIDQSFVRELGTNPDCLVIVRAVAGLGASFGVPTTAEGVETKEQLEQVRNAGCTYAQGYYYGRSMPAEDVRKSLQYRRELVRKPGA